jgi:ribosome-binding factor A
MAKSYRIERLNESIKEILGELLLAHIKDPRVGLVTVTAVRVSGDLSVAKVHYSVMGDVERRQETEKGLRSASAFMRKAIGTELKMRSAPELRFVYDDSLDRSLAIEQALRESARNAPVPEPEGDDDEKS